MEKSYNFSYRVIDTKRKKVVTESQVSVEFSDDEFNKIADAMKENGGYAVETEDIDPEVIDGVWDAAMEDFMNGHEDDDDIDYDHIELELTSDIPSDAFAEAEKILGAKTIDVTYYFTRDGKEIKEFVQCSVPVKTFYRMVELANDEHQGLTDMAYLKSKAPKMYADIFYDADVWANNLHLAQEGRQVKIELREFPFQVYEAL